MSNVLIGIIGVILFIGLALAGALILGDDFRSSSAETKAAQIVQTLHQISAAANMYQMKTGRLIDEDETGLLVSRFLKTYPDNPFGTNQADGKLKYKLAASINNNTVPQALNAKFVTLRIHPEDERGIAICKAIQEQATGQAVTVLQATNGTEGSMGCGINALVLQAWIKM